MIHLAVFQFAKDILSDVDADENTWGWIFIDEGLFYVTGRVNHHKCRIWGSENQRVV